MLIKPLSVFKRLVVLTAMLTLGLPLNAQADDAAAIAAHITGDASRTLLTIELTKAISYKVFALDNPYRVVIDMPAIEFRLPRGAGSDSTGLVTDYRFGLIGPGRSRMVIETAGPVIVESAGFFTAVGEGSAQFKIALTATDDATFAARLPHRAVKPQPGLPKGAAIFVPKPHDGNPHAEIPLVVLDPGHGGPDSGAVGPDGALEKNVVLAIGQALREQLEATGKYKVLMTRDTDTFVTLEGRVDFATQHKADLLVSIHADSTVNSRHWQPVGGATVYTFSETASSEEARVLALRENMADKSAGKAIPAEESRFVSNYKTDLVQTETRALEQLLAEQTTSTLAKSVPMTLEPRRSARFYVLKSPEVPAMLVETGYMNNREDSGHLQSDQWRAKLTDAVAASIDSFFAERGKGLTTLLGLDVPQPVQ